MGRSRDRTGRNVGLALGVLALLVLSLSSGLATAPSGRLASALPASGAAGGPSTVPLATDRSPAADGGAPPSPVAPVSVASTVYLNYNASTPGNFPSAVWDWVAGSGVVDPLTDQLWIPELPVSIDGIREPTSAPALVYDPATNQTRAVPALANATSFAFDPLDEDLYATLPTADAVVVLDPATGQEVGAPIPVGGYPTVVVYDPDSENLFVANTATNNLTVINGTSGAVQVRGVALLSSPTALADDVVDQYLYVALSGADDVEVVSTHTDLSVTSIPVTSPADALAYSESTDDVAVARAAATALTIYGGAHQAFVASATVGVGVVSVVSNLNGTEFVTANNSGTTLTVVSASTGAVSSDHPSVPRYPDRLVVDPTTGVLYSWSAYSRTIANVDLATNERAATSPVLGVQAEAIAYDPSTDRVFVADWLADAVEVLNASSRTTVRSPIELPGSPTGIADASGVVYIGYTGGVVALDALTLAVVASNDALPGNNSQLVVDPTAGLVWDVNNASGLVALSATTLAVAVVVGIDAGHLNLRGLTLDPGANELFAVNLGNGTLDVLNASTGAEIGSAISGIPDLLSVAYDAADNEVYALGEAVWAVDPGSRAIAAGPIAIAPHTIAWSIVYDPSHEELFVVSNDSSNSAWPGNVTVLDGASLAASEGSYSTVAVGQLPLDAAPVDLPGADAPGSSEVWVTNFISGTVSILASPPSIGSLAAEPDPVDLGATTTIELAFSGGAGPSTVSYSGLPSGCTSANSTALSCVPTAEGGFMVVATVVDSLGISATAETVVSVSPAMQVTVSESWAVPGAVDVGTDLGLSASVSGGIGPYNYSWAFGDGTYGWGGATSHVYASTGTFLLELTVTDAGGGVSATTASVTVVPLPTVSLRAAPSTSTDVGRPVELTANVTGGTGSGSGTWTFGDGTNATGASVRHAYSTAGTFTASYAYVDGSGANASASLTITVNPALGAPVATVAPATSGATIRVGTVLDFNTTIEGGTAPYTVVWSFDDGSTSSGVAAQHTYGAAGIYTVTLFVEDAVGAEANTTFNVSVLAASAPSIFGSEFSSGLVLGLVVGALLAAVVLFLAPRSKHRPPSGPPARYVPPTPTPPGEPEAWRES